MLRTFLLALLCTVSLTTATANKRLSDDELTDDNAIESMATTTTMPCTFTKGSNTWNLATMTAAKNKDYESEDTDGNTYYVNICAVVTSVQCDTPTPVCQVSGKSKNSCGELSSQAFFSANSNVATLKYTDGTACNKCGPRMTTINVNCKQGKKATIMSITEDQCTYVVNFEANAGCAQPGRGNPTPEPTPNPTPKGNGPTPRPTPRPTPKPTPIFGQNPSPTLTQELEVSFNDTALKDIYDAELGFGLAWETPAGAYAVLWAEIDTPFEHNFFKWQSWNPLSFDQYVYATTQGGSLSSGELVFIGSSEAAAPGLGFSFTSGFIWKEATVSYVGSTQIAVLNNSTMHLSMGVGMTLNVNGEDQDGPIVLQEMLPEEHVIFDPPTHLQVFLCPKHKVSSGSLILNVHSLAVSPVTTIDVSDRVSVGIEYEESTGVFNIVSQEFIYY